MKLSKEKLPLQDMISEPEVVAPDGRYSDNLLRPKRLKDYLGQSAVAGKLEVFILAAKKRSLALDHVLLSGPPGLGKTTLAHIVAAEMGGKLHYTAGPLLEKPVDLLALLSNLDEGDVLFIDEIHRLPMIVEETLYPAMEDFRIQVIVGEGTSAQAVTVPLKKFTLVGATTQVGRLSNPLRDRFGIQFNLDFYSLVDMKKILARSADIMGIKLALADIDAVARRSRGTPRIANRLLARVRDFTDIADDKNSSHELSERALKTFMAPTNSSRVEQALEFLDVDHRGLQPLDRQYLMTLIKHYKGGPAGVDALAASMSEDRSTLEETVEPFLLKEGFIVRTPKGRMVTDLSYSHLGLKPIANTTVLAADL